MVPLSGRNYVNRTFRAEIIEQIVFGDLRLSLQKSLKTSGNLRRARFWWAQWWAHSVRAGSPSPCQVGWQGSTYLPIGVPLKVARLVTVRSHGEQHYRR